MPRCLLAAAVGALVLLASTDIATATPHAFHLEVTPSSGSLDDTFVVTVTLELHTTGGYDEYRAPRADDFLVKDSQIARTQSVAITSGSGRTVKSVETRRYMLQPKRAGVLAIGPAELSLGGTVYRTPTASVTVVASGTTAAKPSKHADPTAGGVGVPGFYPPDPSARSETFLHVVLDKSEAYVGEQVTVTWLLYTQTSVLKFEPNPPRLDNLWAEKLYEPDVYFRYHRTRVGGVPYEVAVVSKRALFPTKAGVIEVAPYGARVTTMQTSLAGPEAITSKAGWLRVKPLPPNPPTGFDETYVGRFEVAAEVDRKRIKADDAVTMTLTVRGTGALRRTVAPRLDLPGFRFRTPRDFDETVDTTNDVVGGTRTYRYWTSPQRGGAQELPAIEIPYFDPATGRYAVAATKPISLYVSGTPTASIGAGTVGAGVVARDMRPARRVASVESRSIALRHDAAWFWVVVLLPLLGFVGVIAAERIRATSGQPPRPRRNATPRARRRLRLAASLAKDGKERELYAELARLLYDQLEARTGASGRGMRRDELMRHLEDKGYAEATVTAVVDELDGFDAARFSPTEATKEQMHGAIARTRDLLRAIELGALSRAGERGIGQSQPGQGA